MAHTCAERVIRRPSEWASAQSVRLYELQANTFLARIWGEQGERQKAYDLLHPVYDWFTEGFDTPDLIEAKALLDELDKA